MVSCTENGQIFRLLRTVATLRVAAQELAVSKFLSLKIAHYLTPPFPEKLIAYGKCIGRLLYFENGKLAIDYKFKKGSTIQNITEANNVKILYDILALNRLLSTLNPQIFLKKRQHWAVVRGRRHGMALQ